MNEEARRISRYLEVARFVVDNDGFVIIYNQDLDKTMYIERRYKHQMYIEVFDEETVTHKYEKRIFLDDIIINSLSADNEVYFNIGGIDFTEELQMLNKLLDYGDFHFVLERPGHVKYVFGKSRKNPLDVNLQELRLFGEGFRGIEMSFTRINEYAESGKYKIIGYGEDISIN